MIKEPLYQRILRIVIALALWILSLLGFARAQGIEGSWAAKIPNGPVSLRVLITVTKDGQDYKGTIDSPDQGAMGLKLRSVRLVADSVFFVLPGGVATFNGVLKQTEAKIEGTWSQGGNTLNLVFKQTNRQDFMRRRQDPPLMTPYQSRDVKVPHMSENFSLAGTLTLPSGLGKVPAVLLISGSGQQNRNSELMGHRPFLVLADYLTRKGYAVLRYDDRGAGESGGKTDSLTIHSLTSDSETMLRFLRSQPEIDTSRIVVLGHSEGVSHAALLGASPVAPKAMVLLAGAAMSGDSVLLEQNRSIFSASGYGDSLTNQVVELNARIYSVLRTALPDDSLRKLVAPLMEQLIRTQNSRVPGGNPSMNIEMATAAQTNLVLSPWFKTFVMFNPRALFERFKGPMLALFGSIDVQVRASQNEGPMREALKAAGHPMSMVLVLRGHNHLFQRGVSGLPNEYGTIEETFSEEAMNIIADWLATALK